MNNTRMMASRSELEGVVSTLQVDLELFTDTGGTDRAMCSALRQKMADLTRRWEGVTKDFTTTLATTLGDDARALTVKAQENYKKAYYGAIKSAGAATSELFNVMERERLDREATAAAAAGAGEEEVVGAVQGPLLEWMNLYDQILNVCTPFHSMNLTDGWRLPTLGGWHQCMRRDRPLCRRCTSSRSVRRSSLRTATWEARARPSSTTWRSPS